MTNRTLSNQLRLMQPIGGVFLHVKVLLAWSVCIRASQYFLFECSAVHYGVQNSLRAIVISVLTSYVLFVMC